MAKIDVETYKQMEEVAEKAATRATVCRSNIGCGEQKRKRCQMVKWLQNLWKTFLAHLHPEETTQVATPPQVLWPAYSAPSFYGHGYESEDIDRAAAIYGCKAAGLDCLAVKMSSIPNPELSIHLLWYESDVDKGKFLGTWYTKALFAGINKWQVDIRAVLDQAQDVYDRFKAYPKESVQFVPSETFSKKQREILHCNENGVKNTEPEYR